MKKTRMIAILLAVIVMIILAMILLPKTDKDEAEAEPTEKLVTAAVDIPAYTVITEEMLTYEEYPVSKVHPSAEKKAEDVVGATALGNISAQEVILSNHILQAEDVSPQLSLDIEKGMCAATLSVDTVTGISNLLRVGDFVDVVSVSENMNTEDNAEDDTAAVKETVKEAVKETVKETVNGTVNVTVKETTKDAVKESAVEPVEDETDSAQTDDQPDVDDAEKKQGKYVSTIILQNIKILALDQARISAPLTSDGVYEYSTVTLSVTPADAEKLYLCVNEGTVYLILRGEADDEVIEVSPVRIGQVLVDAEELQ